MEQDEFRLQGSHRITATELLDQYMVWRLRENLVDMESIGELAEVRLACQILLAFMEESIE